MDKFRRTTIRGKKRGSKGALEGDLVDSGALIFTKTTFDLSTFNRTEGFWRYIIRAIQWFRWAKMEGNPSTITHVDGWDGQIAFGSDLCDPDGGGLNRHHLPIVPHCFIRSSAEEYMNLSNESVEIVTKRKNYRNLTLDELSVGDFEVIQFPDWLRQEFLFYQEKFRNDDIKYSLSKATKTAFTKSRFSKSVKKIALADGIFCLLQEPFRDASGAVIEVCCSSFLSKVLMAIEHKRKLEKVMTRKDFTLEDKWRHSFKNLKVGFKKLSKINDELRLLHKEFDTSWEKINKGKEKNSRSVLIQLCVDFEEVRSFHLRRMRKLSAHISRRIYSMVEEFFNLGYYERYINSYEDPVLFAFNPECVTPAKLYNFLFERSEKNEP